MNIAWQRIAVSFVASLLPQCTTTPDHQFIRQKIPVEIQSGKPITVNIRLSGNGWNAVGIRCTPVVWQALLHGQPDGLTVRLVSSSKDGAQIDSVSLGGYTVGGKSFPEGYKLWPVDSFYHLFGVDGEHRATVSVEITFKNAPEGVTRAENSDRYQALKEQVGPVAV